MPASWYRSQCWRRGVFTALLIFAGGIVLDGVTTNDVLLAQTAKPGATDKTVNLIVGMPPGGNVDGYARLVQRHLGRFMKGAPTIIVQNKPGAGSLLSVMAVANSPPADGLVLGTFSSSLIPDAVAEPEHFRVDFRHFGFIGAVGEDYRVCYVRSETGIHDLKQLAARDNVVFAASASGTSGNLNLAILKELFKIKLKEVLGYQGSAAKRLAFERGEVDGDCGGVEAIPAAWLSDHKINILTRFLPDLAAGVDQSVPFAGDLLSDAADRSLYDFLINPGRMLGTLLVSDKAPKEKVDELRHAFEAMVADPEFLADAQQAGFAVNAIGGATIEQEINQLYATPTPVLQRAKMLLKE
jgi:tripartite-type tricarboxylate transporter receptor subunit TctC